MDKEPQQLDNIGRNPDGTFKEGHIKIPGSGRPKNTIKDYLRVKFSEMTPEEKEDFLKSISPELQWRMAEGNPTNEEQHSGEIKIVKYFEQRGFKPKQDDILAERLPERDASSEQEV